MRNTIGTSQKDCGTSENRHYFAYWCGLTKNALQAIINVFSMPDSKYNYEQFLRSYLTDNPGIRKSIAEQTDILPF